MKRFILIISAIFNWSIMKAVGEIDLQGLEFTYKVKFKNRYYSPVYWVMALTPLIPYLWWHGILEWLEAILSNPGRSRSGSGAFKPNVTKWQIKKTIFLMLYKP